MGFECTNVQKNYGAVVALKNATISVASHEIRALLGGNGSGKSTLAKVVGGIVKSNGGEVKVDGSPVNYSAPYQAKKHGIVVASQELSLFNNLTVEENILACTVPTKFGVSVDARELKKRAQDVLSELGLQRLMGLKVSALSPNHKYMVEFAKTLVQNPKILILDEITSALYKEDVEIVKNKVHQLRDQGCTIVFITHRLKEIFDICDTVTIMKNGETLATYDVRKTNEIQLMSLMTGIGEDEILNRQHASACQSDHTAADHDVLLKVENLKIENFNTYIDFSIRKGEIVLIAGLQGHGQSDFIRALYGLSKDIKAEIEGKNCTIKSARKCAKSGIAFISGDRTGEGIYPDRTVAENVLCVCNLVFKSNVRKPEDILDEYNVKYNGDTTQKVTSLSGGNQQKVVVSRWLSTGPKLLVADDPTKGIDVQSRFDLHQSFVRLTEKGSSVIMVSSDDIELVELAKMAPCSRVIVMCEGRFVASISGDEISAEKILSYSFS